MIAGLLTGSSSHTRIREKSSTVLFVTLFVQYAAVWGCTRDSKGIVGRSINMTCEDVSC